MNKLLSFKKITLILVAIVSTQLTSCATTTSNSVAGVNRSQLLLLPASYVTNMSNQAYAQTLSAAQKKKTLNDNGVELERVRKGKA